MARLHLKKESQSEEKSRRPKEMPFKQQQLKAWEPILTPKTSLKIFLLIGGVLLAIGVFWLAENDDARELRIDYTKCHEIESYDQLEVMPPDNVQKKFKASSAGQPVDQWKRTNQSLSFDGVTKNYTLCTVEFFLPEDLQPPVLYYYHLENFHQNHRQYINSRHKEQLAGKNVSLNIISKSDCGPLKTRKAVGGDGSEKIIYPCGMITNSYFNDTFHDPLRLPNGSGLNLTQAYNMSRANISKPIDRAIYRPSAYQIPTEAGGNDTAIVPPPAWAERFPNGYHSGNMFDPSRDESFMVWMRTSAGSTFAKIAMRNDEEAMERGMYRLEVFSHFPIHKNRGKKSIIISTNSIFGRRNQFVGRAYTALGACSLFAAFLSAATLRYKPRRLSDHDYLHRSHVLLRNRSASL
ncbi:CDC50 family protein [Colletotrichum musicola]|uniref:CDC50 family protein n=1 Tax=Colletotrichum musicola TaxID=2175873 RepID=A0A8H6MZQ3_9PEZI|nr:CDC50 family protein [Colletotrichum musicola]